MFLGIPSPPLKARSLVYELESASGLVSELRGGVAAWKAVYYPIESLC